MGTSCAPLLVVLFLLSYESEFLHTIVKKQEASNRQMIYFKFRYMFFLLTIRNCYDLVSFIDPPELKIQETTDTAASVSFLDTYLEFNTIGHINTRTNNKRDNFNSEIINFPQSSSNITNFIYIWVLHSPTNLVCKILQLLL